MLIVQYRKIEKWSRVDVVSAHLLNSAPGARARRSNNSAGRKVRKERANYVVTGPSCVYFGLLEFTWVSSPEVTYFPTFNLYCCPTFQK